MKNFFIYLFILINFLHVLVCLITFFPPKCWKHKETLENLVPNQIILIAIFQLYYLCGIPLFAGPVFGNMNHFSGLGIFVDTYPNDDKTHDVSDSL